MKELISKYLRNIEWLLIAGLFIIFPIIFSKKSLDPVLYPRFFTLSVWVLGISVYLFFKLLWNKFDFQFTRFSKFIFGMALLFLIWNVLSSFGVINRPEAIFKTFKEITLMVTFFFFYQILRKSNEARNIAMKSVILMALIYLVIGLVQLNDADLSKFTNATDHYGYWFRQAIFNVMSTMASPNPFASIILLTSTFSLYGSFMFKKFWRILSILVFLLGMFFILILTSKATWGALGLSIIVLVILIYIYLFVIRPRETGKILPLWAQMAIIMLPVIAFMAGVFLIQSTNFKAAKLLVDKVQQVLHPETSLSYMYNSDNPTSSQTRTLVWAHTIKMTREHPVFGVGPGQWRIEIPKYGLDGFESDIRNGIKHFQRPHNDFLWILAELGYPGLIFFLIIYISMLVKAYQNFNKSKDLNVRVFNAIAFAVLIGFLVNLFVSFPRERISHNIVYLLIFALVLAFDKAQEEKSKSLKKPAGIVLLAVILGAGIFNIKPALDMKYGDKVANVLRYATRKGNIRLMYSAAKSLEGTYYTLDPFSTPIPYYLGNALHSNNRLQEAKMAFLKGYKIHPYHLQNLLNLGTSFDLSGDPKTAKKYYQLALDISPRFKEALVNMAIVEFNLKDYNDAFNHIVKVPYQAKNPAQFEKAALTITKVKGAQLAKNVDQQKLKDWIKDDNKVRATFIKVQNEKQSFDKIFLQEMGK